jgi:hypothetical protein
MPKHLARDNLELFDLETLFKEKKRKRPNLVILSTKRDYEFGPAISCTRPDLCFDTGTRPSNLNTYFVAKARTPAFIGWLFPPLTSLGLRPPSMNLTTPLCHMS